MSRLFVLANKDRIAFGASGSLNFIHQTGIFYVAVWMLFTDHTAAVYQTVTSNNSSGTVPGWEFLWRNDDGKKHFECYISKTGGAIINGSQSAQNTIVDNLWHHVVITGDATNLFYIIDGTQQTGSLTMGTKGTGDAAAGLIGLTPPTAFYYPFGGKMAEFLVGDCKMTAAEATALMKSGVRALSKAPKCYIPMWGVVAATEPELTGLGSCTVTGAAADGAWPTGYAGGPYVPLRRTAHRSIQYYHISGISRDSGGAVLGSCIVQLYNATTKAYVAQVTSDPSTGAFDFANLPDNTTPYFIRALKDGTPNVFGVTDDNLVGDTQA